MEELKEELKGAIREIEREGLTVRNIRVLGKLIDILKDLKEIETMK